MGRIVGFLCGFCMCLAVNAEAYFSYVPQNPDASEIAAQGTGENNFMQAAICLDPLTNPMVERLKGLKIKGLRIYMRADYKTSQQASNRYVFYTTGNIDNTPTKTTCKFAEGWNDILFDTPVTIGEEPLYLGAKVYETFGTPYPFVRYTKTVADGSYLVNVDNEGWKSTTTDGAWLMMAIFDDADKAAANKALENTAFVSFTDAPLTVKPNAEVSGTLYVKNMSAKSLTSLKFESTDLKGVTHDYTLDFSKSPIAAFDGRSLSYKIVSPSETGTSVMLTLQPTGFNNNQAATSLTSTASFYVMLDAFTRVPLVEEFTSQECVNCPFMIYYLDKAIETKRAAGQPVLYVTHHSGFASDSFTQAVDKSLLYLFGAVATSYNPAVMYDRRVFTGEETPVHSAKVAETTPYDEALDAVLQIPALAEVNVEKSADGKTVTVSGQINRNLVNEDIPVYLTCYLIENGIPTTPFYQKGLTEEGVPSDLAETFRHNGVIRHVFTTSATGDLINVVKEGETCKFTVSYAYPDEDNLSPLPVYDTDNTDIVAFVHRYDKNDLRNNLVLNANSYKLGLADGIEPVTSVSRKASSGLYDLTGRKVEKAGRGVFIVDGKKIMGK